MTHTFPAPGTYVVTLAGTDDDGVMGTTSQDVAAVIATPPTADFDATCAVNLTCTFDASASDDADGTIEGYEWEWGDGNGRTDDDPNVSYQYDDPGIYPVTRSPSPTTTASRRRSPRASTRAPSTSSRMPSSWPVL